MKQVIEIIKQLQSTTKTNEKLNILKNNSDNETFVKVLQYTYDTHKQYGFSEVKLRELLKNNIPVVTQTNSKWNTVFDMLDILSASNINDYLRTNVCSYILRQDKEIQELIINILCKDLRCGISVKSINKAIPKTIQEWNVQQAYSIDKVKLKKGEKFALSLKLNGIRATWYAGKFRSRQDEEMFGFDHIKQDLITLGIDNLVVDGELIRHNVDNIPDNENFRLTTSIVNSDLESKPEIQLVIFDILTKEEFDKGESDYGFLTRLEQLNELNERIRYLGLKNISVAPTYYVGDDITMIDEILDKVDSMGYEGLMLLRDMPYKTKRHNGILKCKKFKFNDLKIVGYEGGTGKLKDMLGSFIVEYKNNTVNVGSGYSEEQRKEYWNKRDELIGRVIEVKFKEESENKKTGLKSIQFPIFVRLREIGKEVSYD